MTQQNIKRRTLVKGAAWAAPAVAATATVPAYAASCVLSEKILRGGWQGVYPGVKQYSTGDLYTTGFFGTVNVYGIKPGVKVKSITSTLYFKKRTARNTHTVGTFSPSESFTQVLTANTTPANNPVAANAITGKTYSVGQSIQFYDFDNYISTNSMTYLSDNIDIAYWPDKETTNSWAVQNVWTGKATQPKGVYTTVNGCQQFTVNMGSFVIKADNVYIGEKYAVCNALIVYNTHEIEMSDGYKFKLSVAKGQYKDEACTNPN